MMMENFVKNSEYVLEAYTRLGHCFVVCTQFMHYT